MNIVFISALEGGKYSGPLYSVPRQINAQSKIDNVYWVNLTNISTSDRFNKDMYHYYSSKSFKIKKLPYPFNKPDLIIFEEFFKIECCFVARQAEKLKIPYIIIPRCQMTKKYLENKKIKKIIANILLFSHFAKKASAVQFLSKQEKVDSMNYYNGLSFISPNGIDIPLEAKQFKKSNVTIGTFIGRYSIWQKGLDMLIEAISKRKDELLDEQIFFKLYGPTERTGSESEIEQLVKKYGVENIVQVNGPVFDEEKRRVLLDSDFFIHTSRFEGMPMSVLEALSYGLPCLVTQGSNLREEVDEFHAGWGVNNTVESISNGISQIVLDKKQISSKSKNALMLAKKYSWDNIAIQCHEFFIKLLEESRMEE